MERKSKIALAIITIVYIASMVAAIVTSKRNTLRNYANGYEKGVKDSVDYFHTINFSDLNDEIEDQNETES